MAQAQTLYLQDYEEVDLPIWTEALCPAEFLLLHASPVYYGLGVPRGNGAVVILFPGFLSGDTYLIPLRAWLERIGYSPQASGIGLNADCPNLLIEARINQSIDNALENNGGPIHLIGHSLGGIIARSIAAQRPKDIASVITLGAPMRGIAAHRSVLRAAEVVRLKIAKEHGADVLPGCYTGHCTCDFVNSLRRSLPASILETAIYTPDDAVVDWRCCTTNNCNTDFSVHGTHIGLVFNPAVYQIIAERLALAESRV